MRVLLQHPHKSHEISGVVTFVEHLGSFLSANGCEVRVLASKSTDKPTYSELLDWADIVHLNSADLRALFGAKLRGKPVVQHYHYPFWGTWKTEADRRRGFFSCFFRNLAVLWSHGKGWRKTVKFWRYFLDSAARIVLRVGCAGLANARIAVSGFIRDDAKLPFPMLTHPNPLDFQRFRHLLGRPLPAPPRFCFVGRVTPTKGPQHLLHAAAKLAREGLDLRVDIVGSGDYLPKLQALAEELGIAERTTFHGRLPSEEALSVMASATAVVVPSEWDDPAPYTTTEAFAVGRALVVANRGGLPEYCGPGLRFESGNVDALADCLRLLASDPARAAAIGQAGHEFAKQRCGTPASVQPILALYDSLLSPRAKRALRPPLTPESPSH